MVTKLQFKRCNDYKNIFIRKKNNLIFNKNEDSDDYFFDYE